MQTIQEIIKQHERGLLSLEETWYQLHEATKKERLALLLFRKALKDFTGESPMSIAEELLSIQEISGLYE